MAKLTLAVNPTFKLKVAIPAPGGVSADVEFTFRHKTRKEMAAFLSSSKGSESINADDLNAVVADAVERDADMVMKIAAGWDLDDEFSRDAVVLLVDKFDRAAGAILTAYMDENAGQKAKN